MTSLSYNQILSKYSLYIHFISLTILYCMLRLVYQHQSWKRRLEPLLVELAEGKLSEEGVLYRLREFQHITHVQRSYMGKKTLEWSMSALKKKYASEVKGVFADIAQYVLRSQEHQSKVPIFYSGREQEYTFQKKQIVLIICMMALCVVPPQEYQGNKKTEPRFNHLKNFAHIFSYEDFKTVAIMEYLKKQLHNLKEKKTTTQYLTLQRKVTTAKLRAVVEEKSKTPLCKVELMSNSADIEEGYGSVKVDFANKYIGGGAMIHGAVQEEIMFAAHPEMYVSILLCQMLEDNEAIAYVGFKKYFLTQGYGHNVFLKGWNKHQYEFDDKNRAKEYITAVDAINFPRTKQLPQFSVQATQREIMKAYTGFNIQEGSCICTGNWGCGVFAGDIRLKFLIQWIAASLSDKNLVYCPFGKRELLLHEFLQKAGQKLTVGDLHELLMKTVMRKEFKIRNIFEALLQAVHNS